MDKAEYRVVFQEMIKSNKKMVLVTTLKKLKISTGNFYYFLAHEGEGDRTMSVANLELLYKECVNQGMMPTNRMRLESMNTNDFVKELFEQFDLSKADIKEKDMTKWMNTFVGADFIKKK